jgi:hypothetical protein
MAMAGKPANVRRCGNAVSFVLAALIAWSVSGPRGHAADLEEYRVTESPDRIFRIVVLRRPLAWAMPGQAGDAPGTVRLLDRNDHVLRETEVPMVQMANEVEWSADRVRIKFVADWELPR